MPATDCTNIPFIVAVSRSSHRMILVHFVRRYNFSVTRLRSRSLRTVSTTVTSCWTDYNEIILWCIVPVLHHYLAVWNCVRCFFSVKQSWIYSVKRFCCRKASVRMKNVIIKRGADVGRAQFPRKVRLQTWRAHSDADEISGYNVANIFVILSVT